MGLRDRLMSGLARQLGRPEGVRGRLVGRLLNRGNLPVVSAAVTATGVGPGQHVADVGFGGGVGLRLLLDRVGPDGRVHGVDPSVTMLAAAERHYRSARSAGRLALQAGTLGDLPLADGSLDGLVTVNTVYFVEDLSAAFAEVARVLRPSGRAAIGIGDPDTMASMPVTRHGFRLRPVEELTTALQHAGLTVVRHERVGKSDGASHVLVAERASSAGAG